MSFLQDKYFNTLMQLYMQARLFNSALLKVEEQLQKNVELNIPENLFFVWFVNATYKVLSVNNSRAIK